MVATKGPFFSSYGYNGMMLSILVTAHGIIHVWDVKFYLFDNASGMKV